jgi:signal transduction histidine kinase
MTIVSMRTHRHLDVNDAAVRHSGYSREVLGRTKPELGFWVAAEQRDDLLHQLLSSGQARDFEVTFRTKTGEERQLAESLTKAKDEFLAILSHELRNPLGAITNALGVMDRLATSQDLRKAADIIGRQATRLTRLVDDLLDVARVTSGKIVLRLEPVDLLELAERCADARCDTISSTTRSSTRRPAARSS